MTDSIVIVAAARTPMGGFGAGRSRCSLNLPSKLAFTETAFAIFGGVA